MRSIIAKTINFLDSPAGNLVLPSRDPIHSTQDHNRQNEVFLYVLAFLDQKTAIRLLDLISSPPANNIKYVMLKDWLISTFRLNQHEIASQLLHFHPLVDSKSSALMDKM